MVDEGVLTNSFNSSLRISTAALLSIPSFLAISLTRGLAATFLLFRGPPSVQGRR